MTNSSSGSAVKDARRARQGSNGCMRRMIRRHDTLQRMAGQGAVKYGAPSAPERSLVVVCTGGDDAVEPIWREAGPGHVARTAAGTGFGSKLVKLCIEAQLRGDRQRWPDL
ncbi:MULTISPECIES: hypothetical protein [unclassified Roseovarius]|uniref:hypothetical protein n=1 Tax=unclassified Roseovarius TaxID=2614913 RepID=UPI00273E2106|nr:hypothetical protein [Roseovarius sp. MMSF_3350]